MATLPEPIADRRQGERRVGERRSSGLELVLDLQRRVSKVNDLTFKHLQQSASGVESCGLCGEFYLRPAIHTCATTNHHGGEDG